MDQKELREFVCKSYVSKAKTSNATAMTKAEKKASRAVVEDFKSGSIRILCVVFKLLEGFDEKKVSVVGMASPTRSPVRYSQIIGRAIRRCGGKSDPTKATIVAPKTFERLLRTIHSKYVKEEFGKGVEKDMRKKSSGAASTAGSGSTTTLPSSSATHKRPSSPVPAVSKKGPAVKPSDDDDGDDF